MKRYNNLYSQICSIENLSIAFDKATRRKKWRNNIQKCIEHKQSIIEHLHNRLVNHTYHTSKYVTKTIYEPKERIIYILPFAPDRVVHHAIMNVIEPILDKKLIYDTYSCRIGKGQMKASERCLLYCKKYRYCLQLDISKFYPSINHSILKAILRKIFKDKELLYLLDEIIDSICGETNIPIGNYLSQWFGNIYLNILDRFCIKHGFTKLVRYCDDLIIFSNNKKALNSLLTLVDNMLNTTLKLKLSKSKILSTYRGITFLGFKHFKNYIILKQSTKKRLKIRLLNLPNDKTRECKAKGQIASALGWLSHGNCYNLLMKCKLPFLCKYYSILTERIITMKDVGDFLEATDYIGIPLPMSILIDKSVIFYDANKYTKKDTTYLRICYSLFGSKDKRIFVSFTKSEILITLFDKYHTYLPFTGKIVKLNKTYKLVSINWRNNMKGFPKNLNTKDDYLYIKEHFDRELWVPEFQKLLDTTSDWFFVKNLDKAEDGITDNTHKIVSSEDTSTKEITYMQYELRENPTAKIFKLGFTKEEIANLIK